jgi:hypothetical protein
MSEAKTDPAFSDEERRTLTKVLDEVIPHDDDRKLPGAGEVGVADYIEQVLQRTPDLRPVVTQGLSTLAAIAGGRNPRGFEALPREDRLEVLNELSSTEPGFLPILTFHASLGYYQQAQVIAALGMEPHPPHPKGYEMEANDLTLLEPVRRRKKLYRQP